MLVDALRRYSSQRATCKQWSVFLAVAVLLVGALGRLGSANLLWAAAPLLLLGLAEAGYAAQERRCAELLRSGKKNDDTSALLPESAGASVGRTVTAVFSLSIWPFYLGLIGIIVAGSRALPASNRDAGNRIVQGPLQPYLQTSPGQIPLTGQMQQMIPHQGPWQPGSQQPQVMPQRPPNAQNFPARPVMTPIVRNALSTPLPFTPPSPLHLGPTTPQTAGALELPFTPAPNPPNAPNVPIPPTPVGKR